MIKIHSNNPWNSTPFKYFALVIENLLCKIGIHTTYYKYDMSSIKWKPLGHYCQYCDKKVKNQTGKSYYTYGTE